MTQIDDLLVAKKTPTISLAKGKLIGHVLPNGMAAFPVCLESCFQGNINKYPLRLSTLLDSGASLNICNHIARFKSFTKSTIDEYLIAGDSEIQIEGYGRIDLPIIRPDGTKGILRIKRAAYCPTFAVNLISFSLLYDQGIRWDTMANPTLLIHKNGNKICQIQRLFGQWVLNY